MELKGFFAVSFGGAKAAFSPSEGRAGGGHSKVEKFDWEKLYFRAIKRPSIHLQE
jgi:hypothetical protein